MTLHVNQPGIQTLPDGSALVDDLLSSKGQPAPGINLGDPNYDTIAGYVLGILGHIPKVGDAVEVDGFRLRVEKMDGLRISNLSLTRLPTTPRPSS
jgi:putative hemolysin